VSLLLAVLRLPVVMQRLAFFTLGFAMIVAAGIAQQVTGPLPTAITLEQAIKS